MKLRSRILHIAESLLSTPRPIVQVAIKSVNYGSCLKEKTIAIIGGTKGIGKAIAEHCLNEGARVIVTGRDREKLQHLKDSLGQMASIKEFDNQNTHGISELVDSLFEEYGHLDAIVLNAGISLHEGDFRNVTISGFESQFDTNLKSHYFIAQSYLNKLIEIGDKGNLLFVSSETAGKSNDLPYGLSKVAINSLIGGLARRVVGKGIRINGIAPGVTFTDMTVHDEHHVEDMSNDSPLGRFLLPKEIANIAVFLLSDASQCITGEVLYCDAGNHLKVNGFDNNYAI